MNKIHCSVLALVILALAVTATQTDAQTVYTPYAITTFAGNVQGTNDGMGSAAQFNQPEGVAVDNAGNVYVADVGNNTIRKITLDGTVTTLAGMAGQRGSTDGTGSAARFSLPIGLAVDGAGTVYVADSGNNKIRKVTSTGVVTTLTSSGYNRPFGVAVDGATNLYVADSDNNRIRKITPVGVVTTLAGGIFGTNDGTGAAARFYHPQGVALDSATNIFVTDSQNYTIRKITPAGVVTTVAGIGGQQGISDGIGSAARFSWPNGIAVDGGGYVYVVDQNKSTIRRLTPAGLVTTLAGKPIPLGINNGITDGIGSAVRFNYPSGLALDKAGNIYVGDLQNNRIRRGTPALLFESTLVGPPVSDGIFKIRLKWPFPTNSVVEASPDLQEWTPIQTNALPSEGLDVSLPQDTNQYQFFRARLAP